ncbi:MAG: ABC transporter substrate-binding protein [Gammaproteobacteria bacterium]|nr:ABC transporter substrate-binding protein [Gammaproteobacteria bacterium]
MKRTAIYLALGLVLALLVAACGGGGSSSSEPIKVGAIFDLTGPTGDVGTPYANGVRGYVDWLNGQGGIDGRQIDLKWQDYQYKVDTAEQLYSQYVSEGIVAFMGWGTGDTEALRTRITEDEIPFMSASYSEALTNAAETPYNFVVATSYSDQMRIALKWISENYSGHAEIAVFHHDSPFGLSPVADGAAYIQSKGLDMGYADYAMPGGATDYLAELTQAKSQGVTHIIVQNVSSPAALLARDVKGQGLDVTMICLNWCADEGFVNLAGDAAEGVMGVLPWASVQSNDPGFKTPSEYLASKGDSLADEGLHYTQGWYTMAAMAQAIKNVVDAGDEVTGPAIKAALEAMSSFDTGGVSATIGFSPTSHKGMPGAGIYQVENGIWTRVIGEMTP